jgi:hypothetical protein
MLRRSEAVGDATNVNSSVGFRSRKVNKYAYFVNLLGVELTPC